MRPEEALEALAEAAERAAQQPGSEETAQALLALAVRAARARSAFLGAVEGGDLRLVRARSAEGGPVEVHPRQLQRVLEAVNEAQRGVSDAPPRMTGGPAPPGAVAVKADAGQPPVHAFPLLDPEIGELLGVLGLVPDPSAPAELEPHDARALSLLTRFLPPCLRLRSPERSLQPQAGGAPGFRWDYGAIVTRSPKMHEVFTKLDRIIGTDVPVLISGETGTGKELIAKALHQNDEKRRGKRFYAQNCAAIAETVLESELFGHVKGAFTGAESGRKGLFQVAEGSTLFLDEIGEMSLEMQTRLLRVLQEKEVVPVGSSEPVKVSVRLVAATHRDLEAEVARGRFRSDLFYRLKVVRLTLPPLRERPEDVPILIDHFLRRVGRERGEKPKVLDRRDERVMQALLRYPWPGNIRELENAITRLAYLTPGEVITYEHLREQKHIVGEDETDPLRPVRPLDQVVEEVERAEIENALRHTKGNRSHAASLLGINRRSLLRRLQKYGMSRGDEDEEGEEAESGARERTSSPAP